MGVSSSPRAAEHEGALSDSTSAARRRYRGRGSGRHRRARSRRRSTARLGVGARCTRRCRRPSARRPRARRRRARVRSLARSTGGGHGSTRAAVEQQPDRYQQECSGADQGPQPAQTPVGSIAFTCNRALGGAAAESVGGDPPGHVFVCFGDGGCRRNCRLPLGLGGLRGRGCLTVAQDRDAICRFEARGIAAATVSGRRGVRRGHDARFDGLAAETVRVRHDGGARQHDLFVWDEQIFGWSRRGRRGRRRRRWLFGVLRGIHAGSRWIRSDDRGAGFSGLSLGLGHRRGGQRQAKGRDRKDASERGNPSDALCRSRRMPVAESALHAQCLSWLDWTRPAVPVRGTPRPGARFTAATSGSRNRFSRPVLGRTNVVGFDVQGVGRAWFEPRDREQVWRQGRQ